MAAHHANFTQGSWPELPLEAWQDTYATLHMWTQIVGKVRLALSPRINHWWEVALYVNARGLTTSAIPYDGKIFEVQFDFIDHKLIIQTSWGPSKTLALKAQSVADFFTASRSLPWLGPILWYSYQDAGTTPDTHENFFGLVRFDGSKKPAYSVFASYAGAY